MYNMEKHFQKRCQTAIAQLASSGAPHNLQNFTDNRACSKWQGSAQYHRFINPLHTSAQISDPKEKGIWLCRKPTQKHSERENLLFRYCRRMERIAK